MKLHIDNQRVILKKSVIAAVLRNDRGRVIYNTGRVYFQHDSNLRYFKRELLKINKNFEFHSIDVCEAKPPETNESGTYCPFCRNTERWTSHKFGHKIEGYKYCPICGISDGNYYVKLYNRIIELPKETKTKKRKRVKK